MWRRIAGILAGYNIINDLALLFAGFIWLASVPGAADTDPFNPHFVRDVGAAFVAAGLPLCSTSITPWAWRSKERKAAIYIVRNPDDCDKSDGSGLTSFSQPLPR